MHPRHGTYLMLQITIIAFESSLMVDTGGERITDKFCFKHHAIPGPEITATNRIIDATTRLTATIAGI